MNTKIISEVESKSAFYEPDNNILMGSSNPFKIILYIYGVPSTKDLQNL